MTDNKTTRSGSVHQEMESEDKALRAQLLRANPTRKPSVSNGKDSGGKEGASGYISPLSLSSNSVTAPSTNPFEENTNGSPPPITNGGVPRAAPRTVSPPKWSQRHLRHHIPLHPSSSSATPSPSLSSTPLSSAPLSPAHPAIEKAKMRADNGAHHDAKDNKRVDPKADLKADLKTDQKRSSTKNLLDDYGDKDTLQQKLLELKDKRKKSTYSTAQVEQILTASMDDLNITGEDINFDELESFLKESQEDHSVKEALMKGVELKEYGHKVETELKAEENAIVPLYIEMREDIGELHTKVGGCVEILSAFEKLLTTFQADLSNISDDIKTMQDQSMEKNIKINNRKGVIAKLDRFIEDLSLPPTYVEQLEKGQIDMAYLQLLSSFNRKMGFVSLQRSKGAVAVEDMFRKFNVVLDRVVTKVHKYIVNQTSTIKSFAQLHETQQELSSMSFLYQFLFIHAPDNARDVKAAYMDTCDKFYTNYYKSYISTMSKYQVDIATKNDVIGIEDSKLRGFFSSKLTKSSAKGSVFSLGTRAAILDTPDAPPIEANSSTPTQTKYSYDELFRTQLKLLVDQVTCEFFFVRDFFLSDDDISVGIFPRCAELLLENVENYVTNTYDAVGLLIILCLIDRFSEIIPPNLGFLLNTLQKATNVVFTRFVLIFEMNMASIRSANPQDLGPIDIRTHYVTRRYGEFSASILSLYGSLPDPLRDGIANCMAKMRESMMKLLLQLSQELKDKRDQAVFLINNYDLILSLVKTRGVNAEDVAEFTTASTRAENVFVQMQFSSSPHVAQLAAFVDELGPLVEQLDGNDNINHPKYTQDVAEAVLKQFSHHWKEGVAQWSADIPLLFTNFKVGMQLFKKVVDNMFSYYKQFVHLLGKSFRTLKTSRHFISETEIIRELRKYDMDI
eukprot:Phypoly_transcript_01828.p1 GENE.Phypoly_transcript_01828~~Phypoly_transcript_01828.p1  ORF type:complete len:905 (+),score=152.06 Phypoly_transcript_01828:389-3103(+)